MRFDKGPVTFALVGAGGRAACYIRAIEKYYPNDFKVVAIADPDKEKQNYYYFSIICIINCTLCIGGRDEEYREKSVSRINGNRRRSKYGS